MPPLIKNHTIKQSARQDAQVHIFLAVTLDRCGSCSRRGRFIPDQIAAANLYIENSMGFSVSVSLWRRYAVRVTCTLVIIVSEVVLASLIKFIRAYEFKYLCILGKCLVRIRCVISCQNLFFLQTEVTLNIRDSMRMRDLDTFSLCWYNWTNWPTDDTKWQSVKWQRRKTSYFCTKHENSRFQNSA